MRKEGRGNTQEVLGNGFCNTSLLNCYSIGSMNWAPPALQGEEIHILYLKKNNAAVVQMYLIMS